MRGVSEILVTLSPRERRLVGALLALALPFGAVMLLLAPQLEERRAAERDLAAARDLHRWVQDQARAYPPLPQVEAPRTEAVGLAGLEQSLVIAGLRAQVTGLSGRSGGGIDLRFDTVPFEEVMRWTATLETQLGYRLASFAVQALDTPGQVAASLILEPA